MPETTVESHLKKTKVEHPVIPTLVILSAAWTSRSEVHAESKDPYTFLRAANASGNSPRALYFAEGIHHITATGKMRC